MGLRALADRQRAGGTTGGRSTRRLGGEGGKENAGVMAGGFEGGEGVAGTADNALALLKGVPRSAPATRAKSAA